MQQRQPLVSAPHKQRSLTQTMFARMKKENWDHFFVDNKCYLTINEVNYRVLDGKITKFNDEPIVSVGSSLMRELIVLDPRSTYLIEKYGDLKTQIQKLKHHERDINTIIGYAIRFVKSHLKSHSSSEFDDFCKSFPYKTVVKNNPVIHLDEFIKSGMGVCRHHALFLSYLVHNLVCDGLLPEGKVFYHRDRIKIVEEEGKKQAGHAWVIYKPNQTINDNDRYDFFIADSTGTRAYKALDSLDYLSNKYGEAAVENCVKLYNKPDYINLGRLIYSALSKLEHKQLFMTKLLNSSSDRREKILNHQYQMDACDELKTDLTYLLKDKSHKNYDELMREIDRVLETNLLHAHQYHTIELKEDRQQFVLGLLCASQQDRLAVLDEQSAAALIHLHLSLNENRPDRKSFYQLFSGYLSLVDEMEKRIILLIIHLIKDIILSEELKVLKNPWTHRFWNAGTKISENNIIRVPSCIKLIYDSVSKVNPNPANIDELNQLMRNIRCIAMTAISKNHNYRDSETTQQFLKFLKENTNMIQLFYMLQEFHQSWQTNSVSHTPQYS